MAKPVLVDRSSTSMADLTPLQIRTNEAEFNSFLMEIADEITEEELRHMKFLCFELNNNLPRGRLDEINAPREFVNFLRERGVISPGDIGFLKWLLETAGKIKLANLISERGKQIFQFTIITSSSVDRSHAQSNKSNLILSTV